MDTQRLLTSLSNKILIQFAVVIVATLALIGFNYDVVYPFYFDNRLTDTGIVINSAILLLLLIGLGNILWLLLRYRREESAIAAFIANVESLRPEPTDGLPSDSIIARRHWTMHSIQQSHGTIDHAALSAMLNADEATHFGLIRFINNILILTGVFGTIVSLSIALIGASDVLENAISATGMGLVIHGMSTALSTTITAIVCYVFFGYTYQRLTDAQTNLISGVEQVTTSYLIPRFQIQTDNVLYDFTGLLQSLQGLVDQLQSSQRGFEATQDQLAETITSYREKVDDLDHRLDTIVGHLRSGFRLRDDE
ncbi:MAG: hypothetical protein QNJ85_08355 [Gammaproteobacteria bacterium]|nr:hypothetical protein [Gammaproteobacteria bacterium]